MNFMPEWEGWGVARTRSPSHRGRCDGGVAGMPSGQLRARPAASAACSMIAATAFGWET